MSNFDTERLHHLKELERLQEENERLTKELLSVKSVIESISGIKPDCLGVLDVEGDEYLIAEELLKSMNKILESK